MGLGTVAFLSGGTGYTLATKLTAPTPPGGKAAVLVVDSISGGVIVGITVSDPGFGYTTYVPIQVTDTGGGTGAVLSAALQVVSAKVVAPGKGYFTPRFTLTPQFQSSFPDPNSSQSSTVQAAVTATQASSVTGWMRHKLTQALQSPITETAPVVS
jgi:hypothetical protein